MVVGVVAVGVLGASVACGGGSDSDKEVSVDAWGDSFCDAAKAFRARGAELDGNFVDVDLAGPDAPAKVAGLFESRIKNIETFQSDVEKLGTLDSANGAEVVEQVRVTFDEARANYQKLIAAAKSYSAGPGFEGELNGAFVTLQGESLGDRLERLQGEDVRQLESRITQDPECASILEG